MLKQSTSFKFYRQDTRHDTTQHNTAQQNTPSKHNDNSTTKFMKALQH